MESEKKYPNKETLNLKCLICQLNAKQKEPAANMKKLEVSLAKYSPEDKIDVLLFPEMVFSGYHFKDSADIEPFLEECGKGPTFSLCSKYAKSLNSYVICGYPELDLSGNSKKLYNSAYVIARDGSLLLNYRKHHLYEVDHRWASEGPEFKALTLTNSQGKNFKAVVAICMDLNCYEFQDNGQFELAEFCKKEQADALFFLSAWKDSDEKTANGDSIKEMLNYWIYRLSPIISSDKNQKIEEKSYKRWAFFCADRVGKEEDTVFVGCSCALKFNPLKFIGCLDKRNEGFLLAEVLLE